MSKSGSRYGRRSNWFKIHCLLQEQQTQHQNNNGSSQISASLEQLTNLHHQLQARQTYQDKTIPSIKTATYQPLPIGSSFHPYSILNGNESKSEPRLSSPSDSGASSGDLEDNSSLKRYLERINKSPSEKSPSHIQNVRSSSEPLKLLSPISRLTYNKFPITVPALLPLSTSCGTTMNVNVQDEPIDLSVNSKINNNNNNNGTPKTTCPTMPLTPPPTATKTTPLDLTLVRSAETMSG